MILHRGALMQENLFGEIPAAGQRAPKKLSKSQKIAQVPASEVDEAFEYWVELTWSRKGPRPKKTDVRESKIALAIYDYGLEDVRKAIQGCTLSDFHMGNNRAGRRYTDIELILRDSAHIERFISLTVEDENRGMGDF